ncbi:aldose epimerase family protein [Metabacillus rhizolycopersici]|uniref:Aldose 1-epimerase n=1 Tax=Metabacillus rhizolycopersici TaxID=2875709 RepID=A0ABS7UXD8_9BACI|nr:aldose epimerase family protein [Metabacillus rhizolycopersici]MBZ5752816.1 galactose mutarotase [Metabacillus rhizolycopersici]
MNVTENIFGELNGQTVKSFTISNDNGMEVTCIDYGCIITKINVPDQEGTIENVVLGFDTLEEYLNYSPFFGSVIGRVAGRIQQSKFDLDGVTYPLPKNEGENHLHGGPNGFHQVIWDSFIEEKSDEVNIKFSYISPDGEGGYPGRLEVTVNYSLNNNNELIITYQGTSDKKTLLNLTNHSYFNLSGDLKRNILEHELTIKSDRFLELDESLLPTGNFINVENTAFDFREGKKILEGVKSEHVQNELVGGGYDHPFLLNTNNQEEICLVDAISGRKLVVETDKPSVVLYTANMLESNFQLRGIPSQKHLGVCLETQCPPNAIHHQEFPSIVLEKNEVYQSKTSFKFTLV